MWIRFRIVETVDQEPDKFRMQIVMQFIEHNDVAFSKGMEPGTGESEHLLGSVRLFVYIQFRGPTAYRFMLQEDIHGLFSREFFGHMFFQFLWGRVALLQTSRSPVSFPPSFQEGSPDVSLRLLSNQTCILPLGHA